MSAARTTLWRRLLLGAQRLWARADWEGFAGPGWSERIMALDVTDDFHEKQGRSTGRAPRSGRAATGRRRCKNILA